MTGRGDNGAECHCVVVIASVVIGFNCLSLMIMLVDLYDCTEWAYNVEKCDWIFCFNVLSGFKKYTPSPVHFFCSQTN